LLRDRFRPQFFCRQAIVKVGVFLKMIARQKDSGFGWKLEDFEPVTSEAGARQQIFGCLGQCLAA
jgi:hypothetical protein